MKRRQFFLKCSMKNDITQADVLDRLKQNSWEIIDSQALRVDPIGAALKCKSSRCQCCLYLEEKITF